MDGLASELEARKGDDRSWRQYAKDLRLTNHSVLTGWAAQDKRGPAAPRSEHYAMLMEILNCNLDTLGALIARDQWSWLQQNAQNEPDAVADRNLAEERELERLEKTTTAIRRKRKPKALPPAAER